MSGAQNGGTHRPQPVPVAVVEVDQGARSRRVRTDVAPDDGKDLRICGAPFKVGMRGEEGIVDTQAVALLISELARCRSAASISWQAWTGSRAGASSRVFWTR